jgi:hypothetical protein
VSKFLFKKHCKKCLRVLTEASFTRDKLARDKLKTKCKRCRSEEAKQRYAAATSEQKAKLVERTKSWKEANPEKYRRCWKRSDLKRKYGISEAAFLQMVKQQDNCCAICGQSGEPDDNRITTNLVVDHNHKTGKVRKLLCHKCNKGLGQFLDDPELLDKAASYLREQNLA